MDDPRLDLSTPTLWRRGEWTARVVEAEEGGGWAVQMERAGDPEPALVGPWTMGRDKVSPKPLDQSAFQTLVKTARDVLERHDAAMRALLHKVHHYTRADGTRVEAHLHLTPDDDDPRAQLRLLDAATGKLLAEREVPAGFRLTAAHVEAAVAGG
jgi:hypothetical protein